MKYMLEWKQKMLPKNSIKALDQAKEAFVRLVDGGSLDKLADILTGITESSLFAGYAEEGEAKRLKELAEAQPEGTKGKQEKIDIATAALEAQRQATGVDDVTDVSGGAAAGAAIGAGIGVWFDGSRCRTWGFNRSWYWWVISFSEKTLMMIPMLNKHWPKPKD